MNGSEAARSRAAAIGGRLRALRLSKGLSQRELAARATALLPEWRARRGVSYAYISRLEAGARLGSVSALRALAEALGTSVEYLETGQEPALWKVGLGGSRLPLTLSVASGDPRTVARVERAAARAGVRLTRIGGGG